MYWAPILLQGHSQCKGIYVSFLLIFKYTDLIVTNGSEMRHKWMNILKGGQHTFSSTDSAGHDSILHDLWKNNICYDTLGLVKGLALAVVKEVKAKVGSNHSESESS